MKVRAAQDLLAQKLMSPDLRGGFVAAGLEEPRVEEAKGYPRPLFRCRGRVLPPRDWRQSWLKATTGSDWTIARRRKGGRTIARYSKNCRIGWLR